MAVLATSSSISLNTTNSHREHVGVPIHYSTTLVLPTIWRNVIERKSEINVISNILSVAQWNCHKTYA